MAGIPNGLNIGQLLRRMGVKGPNRTIPIVPGIFPTVQLRSAQDLVSAPKEARGVGGRNFAVAAPGAVNGIYVGCPKPFRVVRVMVGTDEPSLVTWVFRQSGASPGPTALEQVGELALSGGVGVGALGAGGANIGMGSFVLQELNWRFSAGERFYVEHLGNANVPYNVGLAIEWVELPVGSIEP